jgi:hypothetical protein
MGRLASVNAVGWDLGLIFFPPAFVAEAADVEEWDKLDLEKFRVLFERLSVLGARSLRIHEGGDGHHYLIMTARSSASQVVRLDQSGKATLEALQRLALAMSASGGASPLEEW